MSGRVFDRVESVVGEHVWNFADFQTPLTFIFRVDGNKTGVFTKDRRPKAAVQVLKKRWEQLAEKKSQANSQSPTFSVPGILMHRLETQIYSVLPSSFPKFFFRGASPYYAL